METEEQAETSQAAEEWDAKTKEEKNKYIVDYILACREEAKQGKQPRMMQNKLNWDVYHMRHDFSHKTEGQSRETLPLQPMAVEQISSFFQQALVDMGDWSSTGPKNPKQEPTMKITPDEVHRITQMQMDKANIYQHVGLGIKSGLLDGLVITKVNGCWEWVPHYVAEKKYSLRHPLGKKTLKKVNKRAWRLKLDLVSAHNYYPDPKGRKLYEIEDSFPDYHEVLDLASTEDNDYAIYDEEKVESIPLGGFGDSEQETDERRRTNQQQPHTNGVRREVKITEFWGTILDEKGNVLFENCVATIANDSILIREPEDNPLWYQGTPFVTGALFEVPDAVWPKAVMDAPTKHNILANEIYNLLIDGGMRAVNSVNQLHTDWLENPSQVENGIKPGTTLEVNAACPPGMKVLEPVVTGQIPPDGIQLYTINQQEFNRSALTSDARSGVQQVKREQSATEVVETSNTLTSVFQGVSKNIENNWLTPILFKSWCLSCQNLDDMDKDELEAILEPNRSQKILDMGAEEIFANTVRGMKFRVFGISLTLKKAQDFKKYMTLIQTVAASPTLEEAFIKKYSYDKLLKETMSSIGIDVAKLETSQAEQSHMAEAQQQPPGQQGPDQMSQVQSPNTGSLADQLGSAAGPGAQMQAQSFPGSRAMKP